MFGFFEKKKEKNYFCEECGEYFTEKHLKAKNHTRMQCPFCGSLKCYAVSKKA